jgi:integrase
MYELGLDPQGTFDEMFAVWIETKVICREERRIAARYISRRTEWDYRQYSRALSKVFGRLPLKDIHEGHLRTYQRARALCDETIAAWAKEAGPNRIRKEIGLLIRLLIEAGVWTEERRKKFDQVRAVHSDVPRAMSIEEQNALLRAASSRDRWHLVYWYAVLALQTTAATNELRGLQFGDINLEQGFIQIRNASAKNKYRVRTIPVSTELARWCLERLVERARLMGAFAPYHYLFPFRVSRNEFDVLRPMTVSGLKKLWEEVRTEAGLPWVRLYDLRHTGLTRMAECGTPVHVMMRYAGHVSMRMQEHYVAVGDVAARKWVQSTWSAGAPEPLIYQAAAGIQRRA